MTRTPSCRCTSASTRGRSPTSVLTATTAAPSAAICGPTSGGTQGSGPSPAPPPGAPSPPTPPAPSRRTLRACTRTRGRTCGLLSWTGCGTGVPVVTATPSRSVVWPRWEVLYPRTRGDPSLARRQARRVPVDSVRGRLEGRHFRVQCQWPQIQSESGPGRARGALARRLAATPSLTHSGCHSESGWQWLRPSFPALSLRLLLGRPSRALRLVPLQACCRRRHHHCQE